MAKYYNNNYLIKKWMIYFRAATDLIIYPFDY